MNITGGIILNCKYLTYEELYCHLKSLKTKLGKNRGIYMN